MKATLALENGIWYEGDAAGAPGETGGEVVFNTSLTGYQEILTDPSYAGQIVTMTAPEIGNYGVSSEDVESHGQQVAGFIVREESPIASNWRAESTLRDGRIEVVVNFAAESHNSLAVVDPTRFFRTNVLGTQTLLDAARASGVERFHHVSTCEVYGDLDLDTDEVFTEESPYRPRTP